MITVGISDAHTAKAPDTLVTYALGSCVGVSLYDESTQIGGMSHVMLPDSGMMNDIGKINRMRFADTAVVDLVDAMVRMGANRKHITAKIAGGANMFKMDPESSLASIGDRNVEGVKRALSLLGIPIVAADTGEHFGRTVFFDLTTGKLRVQSLGKNIKEL